MEDARWTDSVRALAEMYPDQRLAVGLNNVGHLSIASSLADRKNVWFFVDFFLYGANTGFLSLLSARVPRLLFAYAWLEGGETGAPASRPSLPVLTIARGFKPPLSGFKPPLFYSLGCFARHVGNAGKCFDECPKDFATDVRQGNNRFRVVVRDCVTYLFER